MADYKRTELDARAHLGEERFAAVWAQASGMSLEDAVAYALADDDTPKTQAAVAATTQSGWPAADRLGPQAYTPLSTREREVVALIARGLSNREIADRLVLSVRTVERHIENVYKSSASRAKPDGQS
jgi:serine/threonine-protein kinase PknK